MKGRKIDLATANDALILDTFDLMATYGCARDTIRVRMRKGIIPPPLDRVGGRFRSLTEKRKQIRDALEIFSGASFFVCGAQCGANSQ